MPMYADRAARQRSAHEGVAPSGGSGGGQTVQLAKLATELNAAPAVQRINDLTQMMSVSPERRVAPRDGIRGAPVQLKKRHAQKVIDDLNLDIAATYEAIYAYVNNEKLGDADKNYIDNARKVLAAWNKGRQPFRIAMPKHLGYPAVSETTVEDFSGWDSEEDMGMDIEKEKETRKTDTISIKRGDGRVIEDVPLLSLSDAIRLGRQVVKKDNYDSLPFAAKIGGHIIEYNNPGTKDIYATPLEKTKSEKGEQYKRTGTSSEFNFKTLTSNLSAELDEPSSDEEEESKEEAPSKKRKSKAGIFKVAIKIIKKISRKERREQRAFKNIFGYFKGEKPTRFSRAQAEATSAIASDFMKGHSAWHFVEQAMKNTGGKSFSDMFTGKSPIYKPAAVGGRGLVVSRTQEERDAASLLNVNNCLIHAVTQAALGRNASFEELVAIRGDLDNVGEMMLASEETIAAIRRHTGIAHDIDVHYRDRVAEVFAGDGNQVDIYHTGRRHFQAAPPEGWREYVG